MNESAAETAEIQRGTDIVAQTTARPDEPTSRPRAAPQPVGATLHRTVQRLGPMLVDRVQRLGLAGTLGVAALAFCAAYVQSSLLPEYSRVQALQSAVSEARAVHPARRSTPRIEADDFIASLPDRDRLPGVLASFLQQAPAAGLSLDRGAYQWSTEKSARVARYQLTLPVSGSYPAVRKFIDSALAAVPAAALTGITLERPNVGDERVSANLRFEIFVRNTP